MACVIYCDSSLPAARHTRAPYKGWSRERLFDEALRALGPSRKEGLFVAFGRGVKITESRVSASAPVAMLAEHAAPFFAAAICEFSPEESAALRAQRIYWEMCKRLGAR